MRDTVAGWRQWVTTRNDFVPAPRLNLAQWRLLSPKDKSLHDLHRAVTHANLPLLQTPMSLAVTKLLRGRVTSNAAKRKPTTLSGVMISGGGYQGKTETACECLAAFEEGWLQLHRHLNPGAVPGTRDLHVPVAYVQTPVTAKPKSLCKAILNFYGAPLSSRMDLPDLIRQVALTLHENGTKALLLDDITRLRMHRADDQDTLDLIRAFMNMHVTLVLVGVDIPRSGLLREGRHDPGSGQVLFPPSRHAVNGAEPTQTERRFDLVELDRFHYDTDEEITAWTDHLAGVESQLRLMKAEPGMLTSGVMPEYLFERTDGVVGLLERLLEDGCREAIDSGTECLTEPLLNGIAITPGPPGRDRAAGEIPDIPEPKRPAKKASGRRPRNTVLDDKGPAAATGS
ncbi:TniB family NTP-binding protein [Streptomyces griseorubiginosus]|uniref:TniB family NTP-binding protein n=1 Tax=Streptomyces griseorubiginosus TaxID=67304 RepID=UPI003691636C